MKLTDGKKVVEIEMKNWNCRSNSYDPDFSQDFFDAGSLEYDEEKEAYKVKDIEYCIDQMKDYREGAGDYRECGEQENLHIFVTELQVDIYGNTLELFEIALDDFILEENLDRESDNKLCVTSEPELSDGEWCVTVTDADGEGVLELKQDGIFILYNI